MRIGKVIYIWKVEFSCYSVEVAEKLAQVIVIQPLLFESAKRRKLNLLISLKKKIKWANPNLLRNVRLNVACSSVEVSLTAIYVCTD